MAQCYQFIGSILRCVGEFLWHISPALVTVVIGAFALQRFFVRRANASSFVDAVIKDLEILKSDALEYWNIDPSDEKFSSRCCVLEQRLKGAIRSLSSDVTYFCSRYKKMDNPTIQNLLMDLADSATGGDFESQNRRPAPSRYIHIVNNIKNLRSRLLMTKL